MTIKFDERNTIMVEKVIDLIQKGSKGVFRTDVNVLALKGNNVISEQDFTFDEIHNKGCDCTDTRDSDTIKLERDTERPPKSKNRKRAAS